MYKSNTTSFVVSLLVHKMRGGEGRGGEGRGRLFEGGSRGALILNFASGRGAYSKGALFPMWHLFEGALIRGGAGLFEDLR